MRKLEAQEIRALRQAVELELDYRKQMDAEKAPSAPLSLDGELNAQRITILRIGVLLSLSLSLSLSLPPVMRTSQSQPRPC